MIKSNSFLSKQIIKSIVILGVQLVILTSIFFSGFGLYSAQADTSIPPVKNSQKSPATEQVKAKAESAVEEGTENIVKKLNLDEPVPAETKKFFRQIQGKEPIENERIPEVNE